MNSVTHKRQVTSPAPPRRQPWRSWFDPVEPHPYHGPFTRWPRSTDGALAVVVFMSSLIAVAASALDDAEEFTIARIGDRPTPGFILLGLAAAALLWRRRRPIAVTTFVLVIMIGWAIAGYGDGQELALIVATYSVGRYTTNHHHSLATLAAVIVISIIGTIIDTNQRIDIAPAVILAGLTWYLGRRIRNRGDYLALLQDRAEGLQAEQHARARQAVAEERARIARELHDVVAHRVSMMTVQAGAAKTIARADLDSAIDAMGDVERAGRQALGELRHLLGVLRPDTEDPNDLGPQPGLADITALTDQLTRSGADVTLMIDDLPDDLPAAVDLSAYRIVQESLTNIIKHAGPGPTVHLTIGLDDLGLVVDITNTTNTAPASLPPSGYGIAGMSERANLLGGTLTAKPQPPNQYRVQAHLPLEPEPT
ncbi:MAG: sensor histidine kinase [Actinomycetia bacterium]|nr:sensor histidine kinase [Actinomycetes bacterium]